LTLSKELKLSVNTFSEFLNIYLLGLLAYKFPPGDYKYMANVEITSQLEGPGIRVPFIIVNPRSNNVIALAQISHGNPGVSINSKFERIQSLLRN